MAVMLVEYTGVEELVEKLKSSSYRRSEDLKRKSASLYCIPRDDLPLTGYVQWPSQRILMTILSPGRRRCRWSAQYVYQAPGCYALTISPA